VGLLTFVQRPAQQNDNTTLASATANMQGMSGITTENVMIHSQTPANQDPKHNQLTTTFVDNNPGELMAFKSVRDGTYNDSGMTDYELSKFLSRPVRIASYTWTEGSTLLQTLNPWHLYFNDARIKKKIDNFGLLRANLHLKIVLNGSPFYYGLAMSSYEPLPTLFVAGTVPAGAATLLHLTAESQRPKIFLEAGYNKGGEMVLPFLYHKNWIEVKEADNFTDMGKLTLRSFGNLENANGVSLSNIDITIYAWAEDVNISAPTAQLALQSVQTMEVSDDFELSDIDLECVICGGNELECECTFLDIGDAIVENLTQGRSRGCFKTLYRILSGWTRIATRNPSRKTYTPLRLQSSSILETANAMFDSAGQIANNVTNSISESKPMALLRDATGSNDEYGKGVVSKPASAIASFANRMSTIPYIRPFATATSLVAEAGGRIASLFGWSNPPVVEDVKAYRPSIIQPLASPDISYPTSKLTIDPKNELSVDSRTVGLDGTDELSIPYLCGKETYIGTFSWAQSDASGTLLHGGAVNPCLVVSDIGLGAHGAHNATPLTHISRMFKFWRGDIVFRFKFVRSRYHAGRVRFTWDPVKDITADSDTEMVTFNQIYDLSEDGDIEVRVPYTQSTPFLKVPDYNYRFSASGSAPVDGEDNGSWTMRVLNRLTAPDATSDVQCYVFVRAADNYELAEPADLAQEEYTYFNTLESSHIMATDEIANMEDMGTKTYLSNMGERVRNLRSLLRRSAFSRVFSDNPGSSSNNVTLSTTMSRTPLQPGFDPNGINTTLLTNPYNYVLHNPMTWLSPCFVGQRGAVVWSVIPHGADASNITYTFQRVRTGKTVAKYHDTLTTNINYNPRCHSVSANVSTFGTGAGAAVTHARTCAGLSAHAPFYSRFRMEDTNPATRTLGNSTLETADDSLVLTSRSMHTSAWNSSYVGGSLYCAAGIDYSLFFFKNVPTMYLTVVPASATT
jgi:hypothetical protein